MGKNMETRQVILKTLKMAVNNSSVKLPEGITFEKSNPGLIMRLEAQAIGKAEKPYNMQENGACFEGWATVIYTHYLKPHNDSTGENKKIILDVDSKLDEIKKFDNSLGHYQRFLYRAMRFSEEYDWLLLSYNIIEAVNSFKTLFNSSQLVNNVPLKEAKVNDQFGNSLSESDVEMLFTDPNEPKAINARKRLMDAARMNKSELFRQLPVGLFENEIKEANAIFTGKKSAIDLWATDNDSIAVFELKTNNKMIGIITELFFYSKYIEDVFVDDNNIYCSKCSTALRGYQNLAIGNASNKKIKSFFLTDDLHPLITNDVIKTLNENRGKIEYSSIEYCIDDLI